MSKQRCLSTTHFLAQQPKLTGCQSPLSATLNTASGLGFYEEICAHQQENLKTVTSRICQATVV